MKLRIDKTIVLTSSVWGLASTLELNAVEIAPPHVPAPQIQIGEDNKVHDVNDEVQAQVQGDAWMGVGGAAISKVLSNQLGLEHGVAINQIAPASPAMEAGIQLHDIITELDGKPITDFANLRAEVLKHHKGDKAQVSFIRKGEKLNKEIVFTQRPDQDDIPVKQFDLQIGDAMPDQLKQKLKLDEEGLRMMMENIQNLNMKMGKDINQMNMNFDLDLKNRGADLLKGVAALRRGSMSLKDKHGYLSIESSEKGHNLTAKDPDGNMLFQGPMNTEDEKKLIPPDILKRAENLSNRLK